MSLAFELKTNNQGRHCFQTIGEKFEKRQKFFWAYIQFISNWKN